MATTPSSEHVFDVLRLLCASPDPLGVADVARTLALPVSTAHRALASLEEPGFLSRVRNTSKYQPGPRATRVAQALFRRFPIYGPALATVRELVGATHETAAYSARLGWYTLRIVAVPGTRELYHGRNLGQSQLLHEGLAGRAILGALDRETLDRYERFLKRNRLAPSSSAVRSQLRADAADTRPGGAVLAPFPLDPEFHSVALPIAGPAGEVVGALTIEGAVVPEAPRAAEQRLRALAERAAELAGIVEESPALAGNPFGHLDPDDIRLDRPLGRFAGP